MFGSEILEVAIGLVFIYLIASLTATTVREAIEGILKTRAIQLERGIRQLLDDPSGTGVTKQLFHHPLLYSLFAGNYDPDKLTGFIFKWRRGASSAATGGTAPDKPKRMGFLTDLPAYIPSRNFALALMHVVAGTGSDGSAGELTLEGLKTNVQLLPEGRLKQGLLVALAESKGDLDRARVSLEAWFDGTMDRVSGWYKRETSWILFGIGLFTAVALNINTLQIAQDLSSNNTLRQALIAHVSTVYKDLDTSKVKLPEEKLKEEEKGLSDVIGYSALKEKRHTELENEAQADPSLTTPEARAARVQIQMEDWSSWFSYWLQTVIISLPGWFISALAISLGAPFWFDILNQLMVVRSTVKPYEKSQPEGSADRGDAQSHGDPLKQAQVAALTAVGPAQGGGIQAAGGVPAVAVPGFMPLETNVRLAFDLNGADPTSLALTKNGTAVTVPPDGMIELPLEIGISHELLATATKAGQQVSWSKIIVPTADDEARAIDAPLT